MTTRTLAALALAAVLGFCATRGTAADDPRLPETKAFDKLVIDALREVHNKGAELYNTSKDFPGAFRVYQGALVTVRPLLAHRPDAQKIIDTGLDAADKASDAARKAFLLHEAIESVRKNLKAAASEKKPELPVEPPVKKPEDKVKPVDPPKKPVDPVKKPDDKTPVAPLPKDVKPKDAKPKDVAPAASTATVGGKVTLKGQPLADGEVTFVSLDLPKPKAFTAAVKGGTFKVAEAVPAGKYAGAVTGKGVPEKYALINTAGLMFEFAAGANTTDLVLK